MQIAGPVVNVPFLLAVARHADFADGAVDTGFVERERCALSPDHAAGGGHGVPIAAHAVARDWAAAAQRRAALSDDPRSPWAEAAGWRLNQRPCRVVRVRDGEETVTVQVDAAVSIGGKPPDIELEFNGEKVSATVIRDGLSLTVFHDGETRRLELIDELAEAEAHAGEGPAGVPIAPMPGVVVAVTVAAGTEVVRGKPLMVIEAMKVEHTIHAPADGTVDEVLYGVGDAVEEGAALVAFTVRDD